MYLLSAKDLLSERLDALANQGYELQPREDHMIKFSAENVALQQAIESFGSIDTSYPYFATSTAEGPGLHEANVNQTVCFTVITRFVAVIFISFFLFPFSTFFHEKRLMVTLAITVLISR